MREKDIETALVKAVRDKRGMALKFVSPGFSGVPDRMLLFRNGKIGFCELKKPGEKMRPLQEKRKAQLEELGFLVFCVDGKEQIGGVIDAILSS